MRGTARRSHLRYLGMPRTMLRMGWRTTRLRGVTGVGVALATLGLVAVSLGLASGVVASAFYEHRAQVASARAPVPAPDGATGSLLFGEMQASVGDRIVHLMAIHPLREGAPLPPGVARWPDPGEAVLSPALAALLVERGVPDRYGRVVGHIDRAGLASQTELLAYVRLPEGIAPRTPVVGFGVNTDGPPSGELLYDRSLAEFWALGLLLMILPGTLAVVAAARVADEEQRRRHVLLNRVGAGLAARVTFVSPRALAPLAISLAVSLTFVATVAARGLVIPVKGNVLDAFVVRSVLGPLLVTVVVANVLGALALVALMAGRRQGNMPASKLAAPADPPAWGRTLAMVSVLILQPVIVLFAPPGGAVQWATFTAAAVLVVTLPAALATLFRLVSPWRARRALGRGRVGTFVGWRITGHRSRALARLTASLSALVVLVGHAAAVLAMFVGPAFEANLIRQDLSGTMVEVEGVDEADAPILQSLAHDQQLLGIAVTRVLGAGPGADDDVTFTAECSDLAPLGIPCEGGVLHQRDAEHSVDALLRFLEVSSVRVVVGDLRKGIRGCAAAGDRPCWTTVIMSRHDSDPLDAVRLGRDVYLAGSLAWVHELGDSLILGATDLLHKSYWLFVFGVPGVFVLLALGAMTWAAVVYEESMNMVRNPMFAGRADVPSQMAFVRVGLPVATGGTAGAVGTAWLLYPHVLTGAFQFPGVFVAIVVLGSAVTGIAAWHVARRLMIGASERRWLDHGGQVRSGTRQACRLPSRPTA